MRLPPRGVQVKIRVIHGIICTPCYRVYNLTYCRPEAAHAATDIFPRRFSPLKFPPQGFMYPTASHMSVCHACLSRTRGWGFMYCPRRYKHQHRSTFSWPESHQAQQVVNLFIVVEIV